MYEIRSIVLRQEDIWSNGVIQQLHYGEKEQKPWHCLGKVDSTRTWEPVRVQQKVGYAYSSEAAANRVCAFMNGSVPRKEA